MAKPPEIYVLLVDETEYWRKDIVEAAGRLIGVYLYDRNKIVHCAEMTGSYECYFVETVTHERVSDDVDQDIRCGDEESVTYYHADSVERILLIEMGRDLPTSVKMARFLLWKTSDEEWEEAQEEDSPRMAVMEAALEYARCNSVY